MTEGIVSFLTGIIISVIQSTGYAGIFILMALESVLIPIPSEVTMTFAGYLASTGAFSLFWVIFVGAFANLVGSLAAYWLGRWGQERVVRKVIRNYGKYVLITEHEFDRAEKWFRKYGPNITFFSRLLPIVRTFISLPAGIAEMNIIRFSLFAFLGSFLWSAFLAYIGFVLGKNWNSLHGYYQRFEYLIVGGFAVLVLWYIFHKIRKLKRS